MKKIKLFLPLFFFTIQSPAQLNLVKNSGFEQFSNCPNSVDQIKYALTWNGIDTTWIPGMPDSLAPPCLPEYINNCSNSICCSEPMNGHFYQYPHSGNGMVQAYMYSDDTFPTAPYGRDYTQGRLRSTLIAGLSYCVTFYTVMDNGSAYAVNNIGAYFDDGTIDTTTNCGHSQTTHIPQVIETDIINDTLNWVRVQGSFIANGTERFITIGQFSDTAHTSHIRRNNGHTSWYLIDDVSVIAGNATAYSGPDLTITAGCSAYIGVDSNGDGMPCYWYVLGGSAPIDSGGRIMVRPTATTTYVVAMDLCGTVTYDTVTVNVTPCAGPPTASFTDTGTHTVSFIYTGALNCADSVKWNFGDGYGSTVTDPVHTYSASGTYTVCVTVFTFCGSDSACGSVVVSTLASPQPAPKERELSVWPNPAGGELYVDGASGSEVVVYDMVGRVVVTSSVLTNSGVVNIAGLSPGVYIVEVRNMSTGYRVVKRVVKE